MQSDAFKPDLRLRRVTILALGLLLGVALQTLTANAADQPPAQVGLPTNGVGPSLDEKLGKIIISLEFNNATISEASVYLTMESQRRDPDQTGINFSVIPEALQTAQPVTLTLKNVPLGEALRNICKLGNVKFKEENGTITIVSIRESTDDLNGNPQANSATDAQVRRQLQSITFREVNLQKLDLALVIQYLAERSKLFDPDKKGINFVLANIAPADNVHREVSLVRATVPLPELLDLIAQQTHLRYSVENGAIYFKP